MLLKINMNRIMDLLNLEKTEINESESFDKLVSIITKDIKDGYFQYFVESNEIGWLVESVPRNYKLENEVLSVIQKADYIRNKSAGTLQNRKDGKCL